MLKPLTETQAERSLAQELAPIADDIRQDVAVDLGVRPYRVFVVRTRWSGGDRGLGAEEVFQQAEILPTPRVETITNLQNVPFSAGTLERGGLKVDRVSAARYEEGDLDGSRFFGEPKPGDTFYWEIREDGRGDQAPVRRRMRFMGAHRRSDAAEWVVYLERMDEDRDRRGVPGSSLSPESEVP